MRRRAGLRTRPQRLLVCLAGSLVLHSAVLLAAGGLDAASSRGAPRASFGPRILGERSAQEFVLAQRAPESLAQLREPILPEPEPEFVPLPTASAPAPLEAEPELMPLPLADARLARLGNRPLARATPREATESFAADLPPAPSPANEPVAAGNDADTTAPEPLASHARPPLYPLRAERMGWEGLVVLRIAVDVHGRATSVQVETSSGHDLLDRAALETVHGWRFRPGTRAGRPVAMDFLQRISFEL